MGCCRVIGYILLVIVTLFAILVGVMANSCTCQASLFAKVFSLKEVKVSPWTEKIVCPHLADVSGVVVDVGSGTGLSLVCYANNTKITKIYLVEPNPNFNEVLTENIAKFGLQGKAQIITASGAALLSHIEAGSADHAVSIHLLCSVDSEIVMPLVESTAALLKPNGVGKWHMIDHTTAPEGSLVHTIQMTIAPVWEIMGNGCKFLKMPELYRSVFNTGTAAEDKNGARSSETTMHSHGLELEELIEFSYPMIKYAYFVHPHVRAVAVKK